MGSSNPIIYGAISNELTWKNLHVSINITYKLGYYFLRPSFQTTDLIERGVGIDYENRWQNPGDEAHTTVPSFLYPFPAGVDVGLRDRFYKYSEINVRRADNMRLQYINLSYEIPVKNSDRSIGINANIANPGFIWKANDEKLDPDSPGGYKTPVSYTLGLRFKL